MGLTVAQQETMSIRLARSLWNRMQAIQKTVESRTGTKPSHSLIVETWEQYSDQHVIVDALTEMMRPPTGEEIRSVVIAKKATKESGKRKR
jgi:hypothetical protein